MFRLTSSVYRKLVFVSLFIAASFAANASDTSTQTKLKENLLGEWNVALYFSPSNPPLSTTMNISKINDDGTLEGTFYQTAFETARYTFIDDSLIFVIVTADNSGSYSTSGRLDLNGNIDGQTLSTGRNFLMAWKATKSK
ncbi:MAG: hypothetical protein GJ680_05340 [Alteromonadaceae bacterium]|nr:hypothetical protein [Alteromonadaceae bacterium]